MWVGPDLPSVGGACTVGPRKKAATERSRPWPRTISRRLGADTPPVPVAQLKLQVERSVGEDPVMGPADAPVVRRNQ